MVLKWLKEKGEEYRAGEPERRQKRLEKLEHKLKESELKEKISKQKYEISSRRLSLGERRQKLSAARQKAMPSIANPFGPSMFARPQAAPIAPVQKRPGKKRKSGKRKRK